MDTAHIVALVVGVVGVHVLGWVVLIRRFRRRSAALVASVGREIEANGEHARLGPEPAVYRGGSGSFSRVKGNCVLALTDRRVVVAKLVGAAIEIPAADIAGAREEKWFLSSAMGSQMHVVITLRNGDEVGLYVADLPGWIAELRRLPQPDDAPAPALPPTPA